MGALRFLGAAQSESPFFVRYKIQPMAHQFEVIIERDSEGYFVASVPALPGCHTQAKSMAASRSWRLPIRVRASPNWLQPRPRSHSRRARPMSRPRLRLRRQRLRPIPTHPVQRACRLRAARSLRHLQRGLRKPPRTCQHQLPWCPHLQSRFRLSICAKSAAPLRYRRSAKRSAASLPHIPWPDQRLRQHPRL